MRTATQLAIGLVVLIGLTGVAAGETVGVASDGPTAETAGDLGELSDGTFADPCYEDPLSCTGTGPTYPDPIGDDTDGDGLPEN